ncbi:hypothetical protein [Undibacterium sp. TJN19]|uniref:hypothetical protein n=1 Tax=Undibacterium sp. TJN19 TaxID=3413055 RepID=UPI003BF29A74
MDTITTTYVPARQFVRVLVCSSLLSVAAINTAFGAELINTQPQGPTQKDLSYDVLKATTQDNVDARFEQSASAANLGSANGSAINNINTKGQDMLARASKDTPRQGSNAVPGYDEKPNPTISSAFGQACSPAVDRIWLEYRMSDKSALRLRNGGHRGVKVLLVRQY